MIKKEFTEQQVAVINLLLTGYSKRDVCRIARVAPITLEKWLKEPLFGAALSDMKGKKMEIKTPSRIKPQPEAADHEERDYTDALIELIEQHLKSLSEKLQRPHDLQELQVEVTELSDLLTSFRHRAEILTKLLDGATPQKEQENISAVLRAMRDKSLENREAAAEVLARSNELIKKSAALITEAQEMISRRSHLFAGYTAKACGLCKGIESGARCAACKGKGSVLVREPATKCSRCEGNGRTKTADEAIHYSSLCVECSGTGWLMARR